MQRRDPLSVALKIIAGLTAIILIYIASYFIVQKWLQVESRPIGYIYLPVNIVLGWSDSYRASTLPDEIKVSVATLTEIEHLPGITYSGLLKEFQRIEVKPKISGRIEAIYVDNGSEVQKGQLLVKMEQLQIRMQLLNQEASVNGARARLRLAQEKYRGALRESEKRLKSMERQNTHARELKAKLAKARITYKGQELLYNQGGISREAFNAARITLIESESNFLKAKKDLEILSVGYRDADLRKRHGSVPTSHTAKRNAFIKANAAMEKAEVDVARSDLAAAQADYKGTRLLFNETTIHSPITGYVASRNHDPGEELTGSGSSAGEPIMTLIDIVKVYAVIQVKENDSKSIKKGMDIEISIEAANKEKLKTKIDLINPVIDPRTHTFEIKSLIANTELDLRPGMYFKARILTGKPGKYTLIPHEAVISGRGDTRHVFKIADGNAFKIQLAEYEKHEKGYLVRNLLKPGEIVAINKHALLREGQKVTIEKSAETTPDQNQ